MYFIIYMQYLLTGCILLAFSPLQFACFVWFCGFECLKNKTGKNIFIISKITKQFASLAVVLVFFFIISIYFVLLLLLLLWMLLVSSRRRHMCLINSAFLPWITLCLYVLEPGFRLCFSSSLDLTARFSFTFFLWCIPLHTETGRRLDWIRWLLTTSLKIHLSWFPRWRRGWSRFFGNVLIYWDWKIKERKTWLR